MQKGERHRVHPSVEPRITVTYTFLTCKFWIQNYRRFTNHPYASIVKVNITKKWRIDFVFLANIEVSEI